MCTQTWSSRPDLVSANVHSKYGNCFDLKFESFSSTLIEPYKPKNIYIVTTGTILCFNTFSTSNPSLTSLLCFLAQPEVRKIK